MDQDFRVVGQVGASSSCRRRRHSHLHRQASSPLRRMNSRLRPAGRDRPCLGA